MDKPSIGKIVHYVSYGTPGGEYLSVCRAAIITGVFDDDVEGEGVSLAVFSPQGTFFNTSSYDGDRRSPGSWHWPERV